MRALSLLIATILASSTAWAQDEAACLAVEGATILAAPQDPGAAPASTGTGAQQRIWRIGPDGTVHWNHVLASQDGDLIPWDLSLLARGDAIWVAYEDSLNNTFSVVALDRANGRSLWPGPATVGSIPRGSHPLDIQLVGRNGRELVAVITHGPEKDGSAQGAQAKVLLLRERGPADLQVVKVLDEFSVDDHPAIGRGPDGIYVVGGGKLRFYPDDDSKSHARLLLPRSTGQPGWVGKRVFVLSDGRVAGLFHGGFIALALLDPPQTPGDPTTPPWIVLDADPGGATVYDLRESAGKLELATNWDPPAVGTEGALLYERGERESHRGACFNTDGSLLMARPAEFGWVFEHLDIADFESLELDLSMPSGRSLDHDQDGVPDEQDACVLQPETFNGLDDADGCPDFTMWPLKPSELPSATWEPGPLLKAGDAGGYTSAVHTQDGIALVDHTQKLWWCPANKTRCHQMAVPSGPVRLGQGAKLAYHDVEGRIFSRREFSANELNDLAGWEMVGLQPVGAVAFSAGSIYALDRNRLVDLAAGEDAHTASVNRLTVATNADRYGLYMLTADAQVNRLESGKPVAVRDIPDHAPVIDIGQLDKRLVLLHSDGTLTYQGRAGGFFTVDAPGPIDLNQPPWLSVMGDAEYGLVSLGNGGTFQLVANGVEPLPQELANARPLTAWRRADGTYAVLFSTAEGARLWTVRLTL
jgi:hypothetical protein